jgi:hypothetical protein
MKIPAKEILRWFAIAAATGCGLWQLVEAGRGVMRGGGSWFGAVVMLIVSLAIAAPLLAAAYICFRRRYRELFLVLGVIGCILVFAELSALPEQLGIWEFLSRRIDEHREYAFLALPLALLLLFFPIYTVAGFYRLCHRLAYPGTAKKSRTRATRWLIWLGVFCLVVFPMVAMLVTFCHMMHSGTPSSPASISDSLRWIVGWSVIGCLLVFLGLVHRQPVRQSKHETMPHVVPKRGML